MEQLTDQQQDQMLQCLTTEHTALQTARSATTFDSNGRVTLFLSTVSSAIVALAFIGQVSEVGAAFFLFGLVLFPFLLFLGIITFARTLQSSIEDNLYARGINRIRHFYVELVPSAAPYFVLSVHDDMTGTLQAMGVRPSPFQELLTTAGMVGTVNSMLSGVFAGLATWQVVPESIPIALVGGLVIFLLALAVHHRWQNVAWGRAEQRFTVKFPSPADAE